MARLLHMPGSTAGRATSMSSGSDAGLLVDNSVYARLGHPAVATVWREAQARDELVACGPFVGEALYSARNVAELGQLLEELTVGMRYVGLDDRTWRLAFEAQRSMASVAPQFHRRPLGDYLVAAAAHQHRLGVLHYDRDFDLLLEHGGLRFESHWVAEPGSLALDSFCTRGMQNASLTPNSLPSSDRTRTQELTRPRPGAHPRSTAWRHR